ncbi:MAG: ATP-binding cassette domain-containing protein, partial [Propionibacteriaceae bacterium]|nr:ATP-binding cassette domain-containing protein [Propionibacteriaceae bacterium]
MILFDHVSIKYPESAWVLRDVNLRLGDGQLVLVAGPTGSGKSTLLGAINGHVPHFTGGLLSGRVTVDGLDTAAHPPREFAQTVGVVPQDPLAGFVTDTVEEELAYGLEQLGVTPQTMRARVEETIDILSLDDLRGRALRGLSGGQQQRVAIGSVLATGARTLVLDEPTSALDPLSSEEVLAAILRLVHDIGVTVIVAEHRLERVASYADQMILLDGSGGVVCGDTPAVMAASPLVPPVVELGRLAQFGTTPLSVRQARQMAGPLRHRLAAKDPDQYRRLPGCPHPGESRPPAGLAFRDLTVLYGRIAAVKQASLDVPAGSITVIMGRNGSGKSSLLWALTGVQAITSGSFAVDGTALERTSPDQVRRHVRLVPQNAADLL